MGEIPNATAFLIDLFGGRSNPRQAKRDVLWNIPSVELNQLVHVHLYRQGCVCRRLDFVDGTEKDIDALLARLTSSQDRQ